MSFLCGVGGTDCRGRDAPAAMACFYRGVRCKPVRRGEGTPPYKGFMR